MKGSKVFYTPAGVLTGAGRTNGEGEASGSGRFRVGGWVLPITPHTLHPAFEEGTDTGFRNVGQLQFDAGEIPKRTYTIFKSRRKFEINCMYYKSLTVISVLGVPIIAIFPRVPRERNPQ